MTTKNGNAAPERPLDTDPPLQPEIAFDESILQEALIGAISAGDAEKVVHSTLMLMTAPWLELMVKHQTFVGMVDVWLDRGLWAEAAIAESAPQNVRQIAAEIGRLSAAAKGWPARIAAIIRMSVEGRDSHRARTLLRRLEEERDRAENVWNRAVDLDAAWKDGGPR